MQSGASSFAGYASEDKFSRARSQAGAGGTRTSRAEDARRGATFAEASEAKDRALRGAGEGVQNFSLTVQGGVIASKTL